MSDFYPWKSVWITGASTGLGREIAVKLAQAGVKVAVSARSKDKLESLAASYDAIRPYALDVSDPAAVQKVVQNIEAELGPLDLALFNAGTYEPEGAFDLNSESFRRTVSVNYLGAVDGVLAVLPAMKERGVGHVAVVASVAGYRGLPRAAAYGSTKAALIHFAESTAPELKRAGITMSVVNPGFVETPLTAKNDFPMPFIMDVDAAADRVLSGLEAGKFEVAFPRRFVMILKTLRMLPYSLYFKIMDRWVVRK
ncbi:MAG: SDR family NAD(P)-dependent oxidoreductase [Hyphomicrobiales bacterium]